MSHIEKFTVLKLLKVLDVFSIFLTTYLKSKSALKSDKQLGLGIGHIADAYTAGLLVCTCFADKQCGILAFEADNKTVCDVVDEWRHVRNSQSKNISSHLI